ncbi:replication protein, partial [uncultured marine virus]
MSSNSSNSSNSSGGEVILNSPPTKQISPAKRWCFTLNNYTDTDISSIVPIFDEKCKIVIIGKEIGEENETPHLQGYLEFHTKLRPLSLGLNSKIHYEKARGNMMQNVEYCKKEGNVCFTKVYPCQLLRFWKNNSILTKKSYLTSSKCRVNGMI